MAIVRSNRVHGAGGQNRSRSIPWAGKRVAIHGLAQVEKFQETDWTFLLLLAEVESMGVGFTVPPVPIAPSCSKVSEESDVELVLQL